LWSGDAVILGIGFAYVLGQVADRTSPLVATAICGAILIPVVIKLLQIGAVVSGDVFSHMHED
jgi:hypothetical protein